MPRLAVRLVALTALAFAGGCLGAPRAATGPSPGALVGVDALAADYRRFLDAARTAQHAVAYVLARGGWRVVDPATPGATGSVSAGDRIAFVDRHRTILLVVVGERPLAEVGLRLIGAHIDTPAPRLITTSLSRESQKTLRTFGYGGTKTYHWANRALAIVGSVASSEGGETRIEIGLDDDFAFWGQLQGNGELVITTSTTPTAKDSGFTHLVGELNRRYGLSATDLDTAELYVVPAERAREVGLDRSMIGAHGQDDRSNSYLAWRAATDLAADPEVTAASWLVDREEIGSTGTTGARSRFLELVLGYLLRAQGSAVTEAVVHRLYARTEVLSSDTPACVNPNWDEVHELQNAPFAGRGPALFPYTGRGGKQGGSAASAELIARIRGLFERAKLPLQHGLLGAVEAGGGGTISKYLAERGAEVVDLGVCVMSIHSPLELSSKADLWALYRGFQTWFAEPAPRRR